MLYEREHRRYRPFASLFWRLERRKDPVVVVGPSSGMCYRNFVLHAHKTQRRGFLQSLLFFTVWFLRPGKSFTVSKEMNDAEFKTVFKFLMVIMLRKTDSLAS